MSNIVIISSLPILKLMLWILWLWICGWLIRDNQHSYGHEFYMWSGSETWTLITLVLMWTAFCFCAHTFITWWEIVLVKNYSAFL